MHPSRWSTAPSPMPDGPSVLEKGREAPLSSGSAALPSCYFSAWTTATAAASPIHPSLWWGDPEKTAAVAVAGVGVPEQLPLAAVTKKPLLVNAVVRVGLFDPLGFERGSPPPPLS